MRTLCVQGQGLGWAHMWVSNGSPTPDCRWLVWAPHLLDLSFLSTRLEGGTGFWSWCKGPTRAPLASTFLCLSWRHPLLPASQRKNSSVFYWDLTHKGRAPQAKQNQRLRSFSRVYDSTFNSEAVGEERRKFWGFFFPLKNCLKNSFSKEKTYF